MDALMADNLAVAAARLLERPCVCFGWDRCPISVNNVKVEVVTVK